MAKASSAPGERVRIEELHERLYGTVPQRQGEAYERLAAVVFAQLGWLDVEHDRLETTPGGTAEHQLDFVCRHPDGSLNRLVAQCKHWMDKVGKGEMDTLFGVQAQLQWDAAVVITQVGFTRGARHVAIDQDIAMVILQPYAPETDDGRWWRGITATITWPFASVTDVRFVPVDPADAPALRRLRVESWMNLWLGPGEPAETFDEVWRQAGAVEQPDGAFRGSISFHGTRLVDGVEDRLIPVTGMDWTVRVHRRDITTSGHATGAPVFWLEQLGDQGQTTLGRVVTDEQLKLWDFQEKRVIRNEKPDESIVWTRR